jgi:DNA-binding transcriptional ArsR family regulator
MRDLANLLRALADPSRLRILNILSHQCMCVCDLQTVLGLPQPLASRHLASLRHAGLVEDRRGGTWVCYSPTFDGPYGPVVQSLLREVLPVTPSLQADLEKMRQCEGLGQLKHCAVPGMTDDSVGSRDMNPSGDLQPSPGR